MNMFKPIDAKTPEAYIDSLSEPRKQQIIRLDSLIRNNAPHLKRMMYKSVLGYGNYHYKSKSGREGEWFALGLASQKNYISLYVCVMKEGTYIAETYKKQLPKANIGKSCIRFKNIEDIDLKILQQLVQESVALVSKNGIF